MKNVSFKDYAIVACGTMIPEINKLKEDGFLDAQKVLFLTPGLHQDPIELEKQLQKQIKLAKEQVKKIIVVYGGKYCYINVRDPYRTIDTVIDEMKEDGYFISRTQIHNCIDMIVSEEDLKEIAQGQKVWFGTCGWLKYRDLEFKGWDKATANTYFPTFNEGLILDSVGIFNEYLENNPEEILEFSDWMGIPLDAREVKLDRFKTVLISAMDEADR